MNVAVIGGGTMGSMIAWRLAERGVFATVFEQFSPGHDRSAAGGESRVFRMAYAEGAGYTPILRRARELWRELEHITRRKLLHEVGMLTITPRDSAVLDTLDEGIMAHDLDCEILDGREIRRRFPQHRVATSDVAVLDHLGGYLRPELAVATAAHRAEMLGATVRRYARVEAVEHRGSDIVVVEDGHAHRFDAAVVAPGPWLARMLPQFAGVVRAERRIGAWFVPRSPELWFGRDCPVFARTSPGVSFYGMASVDGVSVKLGVTSAREPALPDPDLLDRTVSPEVLAPYREVISEHLPDLHPDPIRVGAYQECFTDDHHALLGPVSDRGNLLVAGGFSGHGFKMAPAVGDVVADLLTSGAPSLDVSALRTGRFRP
ncbi:N-methyl-L-tryptophan oxidase [Janibacter melonis]|uniref:N-methyl-L-tryptophan oxidase n=1 Tax=Janibacter melonis TaxID=262209 RepID=UPI001E5ACF01|nr:N-methyl-L-tryptophan oxidase [Janibacter melonis]MCB5991351.1 N-methyl-L-tryptophan oxidase [Janibacter melonis]